MMDEVQKPINSVYVTRSQDGQVGLKHVVIDCDFDIIVMNFINA
jgi:hypothetical protein